MKFKYWKVAGLYAGCFRLFFILILIISITGCNSDFKILLHEHGDIYWAESTGTINSIKRDGSDKKTLAALSGTPLDVEIFDNRIYWVEYTGSDYRIRRAELDGSMQENIHSNSYNWGPAAIAFDRTGNRIFWDQPYFAEHYLWKSLISSGGLSPAPWIYPVPAANRYVYSICIASVNRKIYFTANSSYNNGINLGSGNHGGIYLYELDTLNTYIVDVSDDGPEEVPFKDIAADEEKNHVFYSVHTNTLPLCIRRRDLSLNNPVTWISAGTFDIHHIALDLKHRKIYWTSKTDNSIYRADLDYADSNVEKFLQLDSTPTGIAILQ